MFVLKGSKLIIFDFFLACLVSSLFFFMLCNLIFSQYREYFFYKNLKWDFSIDSELDHLKIDQWITFYNFNFSNSQRFLFIRPFLIVIWAVTLGFMIRSAVRTGMYFFY